MAITTSHNNTNFGIGDTVSVTQTVTEGEKKRNYVFEGMVIAIKGRGNGQTFTVRRIGAAQVGIERIFPLNSPVIQKIEVVRTIQKGIRRAKLYYTRDKSKKQIELIATRASKKKTPKSK